MDFNVTSRTQTPPEMKWLLVERATLVGDIEQLAKRRAMLDAEMERLQAQVQALDVSIRVVDARVHAAAAGKVLRHCPQYEGRGALKAFMVQMVRDAVPGISVRMLARLTAAHFGIEFVSDAELTSYCRNSVGPQLRRLREEGLVENFPGPGPGGMLWRWKSALPTLADLARLPGGCCRQGDKQRTGLGELEVMPCP